MGRAFGEQLGDLLIVVADLELDDLKLEAAGLDLGEVQDVVDDRQQASPLARIVSAKPRCSGVRFVSGAGRSCR